MRLWWQWGAFGCAWTFSILSARIWPSISQINESYHLSTVNKITSSKKEDVMAMMILKPFHYIISCLLLLFTLFILAYLLKKVIYECKVAYMLKQVPYEPIILLVMGVLLLIKNILFFPYLTLCIGIIVIVYECSIYFSQRNEEVIYVKEG